MIKAILNVNSNELDEKSPSYNSLTTQDQSSAGSVKVTDEMEAIFISCLYSSLGAALEGNSRLVFDEFLKKISGLVKVDDTPVKRATFSKSFCWIYIDKYISI